eukprot:jgi/Galph1/3275/GphlegSOOS_G1923.1
MRWTFQSYLVVALATSVAAGVTVFINKYRNIFFILRARWFRDVFEDLRLRLRASEAAAIRERLDLLEAKILSGGEGNITRLSVNAPHTLAEEKPSPDWELVTKEDFVILRTKVDELSKTVQMVQSTSNKAFQVSENILRQYMENAKSTKEQLVTFSEGITSLLGSLQQLEKATNSVFQKLEDSSGVMKALDTEVASLRSFVEDLNEEIRNLKLLLSQSHSKLNEYHVFHSDTLVGASIQQEEELHAEEAKHEEGQKDSKPAIETTPSPRKEESVEWEAHEEEKSDAHVGESGSGEKKKRKKKKKRQNQVMLPIIVMLALKKQQLDGPR